MNDETTFIILAGPTGVGKTELSLELAEQLRAEIISADSRQVYRGLDIGTATPEPHELARVPHHFINERELDAPLSAGQFASEAWQRIREIQARGRVPLVVGGSTLYLYALQFGLADIPDVDASVREELEERLERAGAETLFAELQAVDPDAAETLDPTKTQRLVRALEVFHGTGKPLTWYHEHQPTPPFCFDTYVLHRDRTELYDRINRRVDRMLHDGLLDEVQTVMKQGYDPAISPLRTIGYREPLAFLRGDIDYDEMTRLIKRNSRRYAKRQLTWFRRFESFTWLDAPFHPDDVLASVGSNT